MNRYPVTRAKDITRSWHLVDAKGKILGRLAAEITPILAGKNKSYYVPYLDCGDNVVVVNTAHIKVTGRKEKQKIYYRHSQYPGGLKTETLGELRARKPEDLIYKAVWGMMPKGRLGRQMIKKLHVFAEAEHPFQDKFKTASSD